MNHPKELIEKVNQLPQQPGVYQFLDSAGKLLYIGKATHLRSRVQSYFRDSTALSDAKLAMVARVHSLETIVVDNETEALLLETTLIKEHKPPYNIVMKDDKNFQYIHITADRYPRLETTRRRTARGGLYFGPYTSGRSVRRVMAMLKSIFRYCTTPPVEKSGKIIFPKRPCLDYHLGRCIGPCANTVSAEEYAQIFVQIRRFLEGGYEDIQKQVQSEMVQASEQQQFELAARYRDQLQAIEQLMVEQKVVSTRRENADYLSLARINNQAAVNIFQVRRGVLLQQEMIFVAHAKDHSDQEILEAVRDQYYAMVMNKPKQILLSTESRRGRYRKLLEMGSTNARAALERHIAGLQKRERKASAGLQELADALGLDASQLHRIEIYDISNIQGSNSVGSMVVFIDGVSAPTQYRKFKIKTVQGPNDFASLREVMDRRLQHLPERLGGKGEDSADRAAWPKPDLMIIDGGKGQLSAAKSIIDIMQPDIRVVSLAKQEEEIFVPGRSESIRLPEGSEGYHLVQRMRDEAHRFAIGFYRSRHLKELV